MSQPITPAAPVETPTAYTAFVPTPASFLPVPNRETCANCLAPLAGHFCSQCGAPRLEERPLTVRRFAGDLWTELTSVDSATVRSLRALLLEPGRLTREYLDGRTRWFLSPLRLFLLTTTLMVLVSATTGYQQRVIDAMRTTAAAQQRASAAKYASPAPARATTTAAAAAATPAKALSPRKLRQRAILRRFKPESLMSTLLDAVTAIQTSAWLQIGNPIAVGLALALVLRRKRRNYAEHFVHALHFMAFSALLTAALIPLRLTSDVTKFFTLVTLLYWIVAARYFFVSARRIYADSTPRTLADTALFAVSAQSAMMLLPLFTALAALLWVLASLVVRLMLA